MIIPETIIRLQMACSIVYYAEYTNEFFSFEMPWGFKVQMQA
jgi:hypothetical protein